MQGTHPPHMSEIHVQHSHLTMRGTNPFIYVTKAHHLHSTMRRTNPTYMSKGICTYIWSCRNNPTVTLEWLCTYIWSWRNQSYSHIRMALSPRLRFPGNWPGASIPKMAFNAYIWSCRNQYYNHIRMTALTYDMEGTNPLTMTEWTNPYIWPWKEPNPLTMSEWL